MALTIYPATGWDSFISTADATTVINNLSHHGDQWSALGETDKERYLRIACRYIVNHSVPEEEYPDPMPQCVGEAQALTAANDMANGLSASTGVRQTAQVRREKAGDVEVEYFRGAVYGVPFVPPMAAPCLETNMGFSVSMSQVTLGRA